MSTGMFCTYPVTLANSGANSYASDRPGSSTVRTSVLRWGWTAVTRIGGKALGPSAWCADCAPQPDKSSSNEKRVMSDATDLTMPAAPFEELTSESSDADFGKIGLQLAMPEASMSERFGVEHQRLIAGMILTRSPMPALMRLLRGTEDFGDPADRVRRTDSMRAFATARTPREGPAKWPASQPPGRRSQRVPTELFAHLPY